MSEMPRERPSLDAISPAPEFLHRSVADAIRRRLVRGELAGGAKLPTLREIADDFSVSTMTVRRAIHTLERENFVYRIPGVGVFVRPRPPDTVAVSQKTVAFVGSDLSSPFQMSVARGAQRACQKQGWAIQVLDAHFDAELEARNLARLPDSVAQGAIILPPLTDSRTVDTLFQIHSAEFPLVVVDQTLPALRADLVASDHEAGAHRATNCLLRRGYSRVVLLSHPPISSSVEARVMGYERALRENGQTPPADWKAWIDQEVQLAGYRDMRKWLGGYTAIKPRLTEVQTPLAVLAIDAYTGWGVYEACRELGLRIPQDVAVVAFDDSEVAYALRPAMTIIAQRTEEIGEAAVGLLERRIRGDHAANGTSRTFVHMIIDVDLIERQSVGSPKGSRERRIATEPQGSA